MASSHAAACATPASPTALAFPDESLERTCKRLNKLTKDKSLDRVLFRAKAAKGKLPLGADIELHPMLEAISEEEVFDPYTLAAIDEFATSPACSKIHLSMLADFQVEDVKVIQPGGVTARTLFHEMEAFWENTANDDTCSYHGTSYGKGHTYGTLWDWSTYGMEGDVWSAPQVGMDGAITLSPYFGC
ncbi:hypothetical protein JCM10450v2_005952 [Rhodotorula kratochvilovae]